jgi:pimeloyl-ACP methyl ester carboxylesterase
LPYCIARDGAKLHYVDIGRGPVCVLLHGYALFGATWLPFVLPFANKFRFILPSLRGFGPSDFPTRHPRGLSEVFADDLEMLLDHLEREASSRGGLGPVRLGGHSLGALTAMAYHRKYGFDRIAAYLHIDQSPCIFNLPDWRYGFCGEEQDVWLDEFEDLFGGGAFDALSAGFAKMPAAWRKRAHGMLVRFGKQAVARSHLKAVTNLGRNQMLVSALAGGGRRMVNTIRVLEGLTKRDEDFDFRDSLRRVTVPVTVFVGAKSLIYPARGQEHIQSLIAHARIVRFEAAGHSPQFDSPIEFVARLAEFLRQDVR